MNDNPSAVDRRWIFEIRYYMFAPNGVRCLLGLTAGRRRWRVSITFKQAQDAALHDDFNANKYRTRVKDWINEAVGRIYRRVNLTEAESSSTISVVGGTQGYALPTGNLRIESIYHPTYGELLEIDVEEFDDLNRNTTATGRPSYYTIRQGQVQLYPKPSASDTLNVRYERGPTVLVNDDDLIPLPDDFDYLPVTYARARLHLAEGDVTMYQALKEDLAADIRELQSSQRRSDRIRQIPGHWLGVEAVGPRIIPPPSWS